MIQPLPPELAQVLGDEGRRRLAHFLKAEQAAWLAELEQLGEDLCRELERARETMPEDAPRAGGDHFLWEEDTREFEALKGLAELEVRLEERIRALRSQAGTEAGESDGES